MTRSLLVAAAALAAACLVPFWVYGADPDARRTAHFLDHRPPHPPARVVSLAPVTTEIAFALGAGDRVVAVTRFCDRPAAAKALPKVGGYVDVNLEALLAQKPDLVLAMPSSGQRDVLEQLTARGIPVFVGFADRLRETRDLIAGVGRALGVPKAGQRAVADFDQALAKLSRPPVPDAPRVLVAVATRPLVVAGRDAFAAEAVALIGARLALSVDAPWPVLSLEAVASLDVDVVVAAEGPAAGEALRAMFAPLGKSAPAVRAPDAPILMRPGVSLPADVAILRRLVFAP